MKRILLWGLAAAVLGMFVTAYYFLETYGPAPVDPRWAVQGSREIPKGAVTVRFTGTSTLLFSDGETDWMIDGWFTRPGPLAIVLGEIEPDLAAIVRGLASNRIDRLAVVIPAHSHYDHAMDSPEVARRTRAILWALNQPLTSVAAGGFRSHRSVSRSIESRFGSGSSRSR